MTKYIIKRVLWIIPVMIGASFLVFALLSMAPGDPAQIHAGLSATEAEIEQFRVDHGLDKPFLQQYFTYITNVFFKGDLGNSYATNTPIADRILQTFPVTLKLSLYSLVVMLLIGVPLGIVSALKQYSVTDTIASFLGMVGVSMPNFWFALQLILIFSLSLGWLPVSGSESFKYFILPTITAGIAGAARIMRTTRSAILEVYRQDYIKTAEAKGQKRSVVIWRHMLKNAAMPIITVVASAFCGSLANSTVIETIFSMPGMCKLMVDSIVSRDNIVVTGTILVLAAVCCIVNLITDLLFVLIDPRIKSQFAKKQKS